MLVLANEYKNSVNRYGVSLSHFYGCGVKLLRDARIQKIDLTPYSTIQELVASICKHGNALEKSALADAFDFTTLLSMPEVKDTKHPDLAIEFIKANLADLAIYFGTTTTGDSDMLAWLLFQEYGGLTMLDFIKFFSMCKKREFTGEFEFVKTQGINPDFIIKWIDKYCLLRDNALSVLERDSKDYHQEARPVSGASKEKGFALNATLKEMEDNARMMRAEFEKSLYEKGTMVFSDSGVDMEIPTDVMTVSGAKRQLFHYLFHFVSFDEDRTKASIKRLGERFTDEYNDLNADMKSYLEQQGTVLEEYKRQQAIQIAERIKRFLRTQVPVATLERALDNKTGMTQEVKNLLSSLGVTVPLSVSMLSIAQMIVKNYEATYFDYLKTALDTQSYPLSIDQYIFQQVLILMKNTGIKRPFEEWDMV